MKLFLNVLRPVVYEYSPNFEDLTFVTHPDETPGADLVWEMFKGSDLWRGSKALGINFKKKLEDKGYDFKNFDRECSYTLTGAATRIFMKDLKNYPEVNVISEEEPGYGPDSKNIFYEFRENTEPYRSVLLLNPVYDCLEMQVLPCTSEIIELDAPPGAPDYYTADGYYVLTQDKFDEILSGFPESRERLESIGFKQKKTILRWEGLLRDTPRPERPWLKKLETLKSEVDKIIESKKLCTYMKDKKIEKLIKHYYG